MEEAIKWAVDSLTETLTYEYYTDPQRAEVIRLHMATLSGKPYRIHVDEHRHWILQA